MTDMTEAFLVLFGGIALVASTIVALESRGRRQSERDELRKKLMGK